MISERTRSVSMLIEGKSSSGILVNVVIVWEDLETAIEQIEGGGHKSMDSR